MKKPEEEFDEISDVVITVEKKIPLIEEILRGKGKRFFYIKDLLEEAEKTMMSY